MLDRSLAILRASGVRKHIVVRLRLCQCQCALLHYKGASAGGPLSGLPGVLCAQFVSWVCVRGFKV